MSHVTDVILITELDDVDQNNALTIDKINGYISKKYNNYTFTKVNNYAGGGKAIQCDVFMMAINYFDIDGFVTFFNSIKFGTPECVQLLIKDKNDNAFTIHKTNNFKVLISGV